jgi:hypothetical protein
MTAAQGIEKLGFRRWYERQLIQGHLYFVTCFVSLIVLATCLEQIDWHGSWGQQLWMAALVVGSAILCFKSLRWYNFLLARAEALGAQSNCAQCSTYGVLKVIGAGQPAPETERGRDNSWIRVRCKKCGHEWRMDNT